MNGKKLLLHVCCAPCATYPLPLLRGQGFHVMGFFYNPNIHPCQEYGRRETGVKEYAEKMDLEVIYGQEYNPLDFFRQVCFREQQRCMICYHMRLQQTAGVARRGKFDFFTSTLLVSKQQDHALIRAAAETVSHNRGVDFYYHDFREGFADTVQISKEMGLYRQQYCGCLYSEWDRYKAKPIKDQSG